MEGLINLPRYGVSNKTQVLNFLKKVIPLKSKHKRTPLSFPACAASMLDLTGQSDNNSISMRTFAAILVLAG